jgi:1-acyl-sn-glycerol-3-phosphate acyltransferase
MLVDQRIDPHTLAQIERLQAGQGEHGFDLFGFEPRFLRYMVPPCQWLLDRYFRAETHGLDNIPDDGPVLLIANHSGQLPLDGMMIGTACLLRKDPPRMIRSMVEHWVPTLPFVSWIFARAGQVVGTRENARTLLKLGNCLLVFPEGARGISKTYDRAYQLEEFGLGFMRLALETGTPIVPVGVVGAEEQMPAIANIKPLGRALGMPAFPITPTWPLLGPLGALPLPVKYHIHFGQPMRFTGAPDDEDRIVRAQVEQVKDAIRGLIDRGLRERKGVFR